MCELLPTYLVNLLAVRNSGFLRTESLPSEFFANSSYYGVLDISVQLTLRGNFIGSENGEAGTYYFEIGMKGVGVFSCTRCLQAFSVPLTYDGELMVHVVTGDKEKLDDVVWEISPARESLDLGDYLRESLYLGLPMSVKHGDFGTDASACDTQMLRYIQREHKGVSLGNICGAAFESLDSEARAAGNESKKKKEE